MKALTSIIALTLLCGACGKKTDDTKAEQATATVVPCAPGLSLEGSTAIATINGKAIPCSELYARDKEVIDAITAKYDEKILQIHVVALSEMIDDRLLQAAADEANLTVERFVASSISAVPATEEDVKTFYEQAVASGEKLPPFEETKADIASFITERRQKASLTAFRRALRAKSTIEILDPKLKAAPVPVPAPVPAPPGSANPPSSATPPGSAP